MTKPSRRGLGRLIAPKVRAMSTRVDLDLAAIVDRQSQKTGLNRSDVLRDLIQAGAIVLGHQSTASSPT